MPVRLISLKSFWASPLTQYTTALTVDPVRAIIMRHCCLVFVPDGADSLLLILQEMFRDATHQDGPDVPFEFKYVFCLHHRSYSALWTTGC
jgi:hypothetical protein